MNSLLRTFLTRLAVLGALLGTALPAFAQTPPPTLPANTVWGRSGIGPGPGQALPFATLLSNLPGVQSANTVWAGPTSGGAALPTWRGLVFADMPSLPAFSANLGGSNQTGIASNTPTIITFNTTVYNVGSYFNTGTNRWTPPAGTVTLSAAAFVSGTWTTASPLSLLIYKNGSALFQAVFSGSTANQNSGSVSFQDRANGTDYYQVVVQQTTTSSTVTAVGSTGPTYTYFMGVWNSP